MSRVSNENTREASIEIDLKALYRKIISKWYVLVIGILVGALCGVLYYGVLSKPKYESTSMIYLRTSNKKLSLESLQLNTSLTQDYEIIFTSRPNLEKVIKTLHLKYTTTQLKRMISINNPDETRILEVQVQSYNPVEAKNIANSLVNYGMDDIREIDSQEPFLVEKAITINHRVGIGLVQTIFLSAILFFVITLIVIVVRFIINDTIISSEDAEKTLGLPVLAVIAEDKSLAYAKLEATSSRRRKHHGKKTSK